MSLRYRVEEQCQQLLVYPDAIDEFRLRSEVGMVALGIPLFWFKPLIGFPLTSPKHPLQT